MSPSPYTANVPLLKKGARLAAGCAALCVALGGCSVSLPMGSLIGSHDDEQTASVAKPQIEGLAGEDWRRAKIALDSALAEGDSTAVAWDNPDSGTKGSFAPIGEAYATNTGTCRGFRASIDRKDADDALQGTACADKSGDWVITDVKPWNKG